MDSRVDKSSDFGSADIIQLLAGANGALIERVSDSLYSKLVQVFASEIPTIKDWTAREKKLKWVLRAELDW